MVDERRVGFEDEGLEERVGERGVEDQEDVRGEENVEGGGTGGRDEGRQLLESRRSIHSVLKPTLCCV